MRIEQCHEVKTDFIIRAVKEAIKVPGKHEIINSDQGSQFTSKDYIDCIKSNESINTSMDGEGRAKDNARTERFSVLINGKGFIYSILKQCLS